MIGELKIGRKKRKGKKTEHKNSQSGKRHRQQDAQLAEKGGRRIRQKKKTGWCKKTWGERQDLPIHRNPFLGLQAPSTNACHAKTPGSQLMALRF